MIKSMFSAVSGLKSHQTMMDTIGNNIANVNTAGFKSSRVVFTDLFYQTINDAQAPTATTSGSNPKQTGYGAAISTIDVLNTRSGFQQTYRTMDQYISGDGYFIVDNGLGGKSYTRVGNLKFDTSGNLVDGNGSFVCGQMAPLSGTITTPNKITIANFNNYTGIAIGKDGKITGVNLTTNKVDDLAQIGLAIFPNADGLSQEGNTYMKQTNNSGAPSIVVPGNGGSGPLVQGGLEMSNVDLSKELTDMIIAQRGFQANSRVITTSDEILQELVNLKR